MCGIYVTVSEGINHLDSTESSSLRAANALRGPDHQQTIQRELKTSTGKHAFLTFTASVLHLRGDHIFTQPHVNRAGDVLCWNGEIFQGMDIALSENDGVKLFEALTSPGANIVEIFGSIEGPYAFVFYRASDSSLFFARDPLGRRSLLLRSSHSHILAQPPNTPSSDSPINPLLLELSSVSIGLDSSSIQFEDLPTEGIYQLCFSVSATSGKHSLGFELKMHERRAEDTFSAKQTLNRSLPIAETRPGSLVNSQSMNLTVLEFTRQLEESVRRQVINIPPRPDPSEARLAILFSGGIDCAVIAFMADRFIPPNEPIDLLNVAFENPRSLKASASVQRNGKLQGQQRETYDVPDRLTGLDELEELKRLCPLRKWKFVKVDVTYDESTSMKSVIQDLMYPSRTVMDLSLAMALYFASRGIGKLHDANGSDSNSSLPFEPYTTTTTDSTSPIPSLPTIQPYKSPALVLLSGLGSDELLGGYSRHRVAWKKAGWGGLLDELQLDLDRLPTRNLGRDDRVISSHGKETRFPYLDLSFITYVARLEGWRKVYPERMEGEQTNVRGDDNTNQRGGESEENLSGDKYLLRLAAHRMGLVEASKRKKRAMQFGSRSAKMSGAEGERKGDLLVAHG